MSSPPKTSPHSLRFFCHACLSSFLLILAVPDSGADVLINELHANPPGQDDAAYQYVEILSVNEQGLSEAQVLPDLSLVFVDSDGRSVGRITEVLRLEGLTTGDNGLLLIGPRLDIANPWTVDPATAVVDFGPLASADGLGSIGPKDGLTLLLVEAFAGAAGEDLDPDDDGLFDATPWSRLVDSVGFGDTPYSGTLSVAGAPDHMARIAGERTSNFGSSWYGGNIVDTDGGLSLGIGEAFGLFAGRATPGQLNVARLEAGEAPIRINEVLVNPPGNDSGNVEFIELLSVQGGVTSTDGLWILLVDSTRENGVGEVMEAWDLSGGKTGPNGLLLLGNDYGTLSNPWRDLVSPATDLADPPGMGDGDIGSNSGLTMLLVRDFTGSSATSDFAGDDLDVNDDGVIDQRPWSTEGGAEGILDSVGFSELDLEEGEVIQSTYALADVTPDQNDDLFHPDSVFRKTGDLTANSSGAWAGGNIGGINATGISYRPDRVFGEFLGEVTPGQSNPGGTVAQGMILINEVHLDPVADPDGNYEYVELISPTGTFRGMSDLSLLMVDVDGFLKGEIRDVFDLRGLSTGPDGLLLIGHGYDMAVPYELPPDVHRADPPGLDANEIGPPDNNSMGLLLVEGFRGAPGDDLDADDDGFFDASPWIRVMDGVGFGGEFQQETDIANLKTPGIIPDSLSRIPGNVSPNDTAAWYGGALRGPDPKSSVFARSFGPFQGEATPGRRNLAGPRGTAEILINEVHVNPPGSDRAFEFIELFARSGTSATTQDLTLLLLDNSGDKTGEILQAWSLDGTATGSNGLLLLGDGYTPLYDNADSAGLSSAYFNQRLFPDRIPRSPFGAVINHRISAAADPRDFNPGSVDPNSGFALLLVSAFTGSRGNDLDTDDDGVFDERPWRQDVGADGILDSVGFREYDDETQSFPGNAYALADVSQQAFVPDSIARRGDQLVPNTSAAWYGGVIAGDESTSLNYGDESFGLTGMVTPGTPNAGSASERDDDGDGITNGDEEVAGTDPDDPSDYLHFNQVERLEDDAVLLRWRSVAGKSYHVEFSESLQPESWTAITADPIVATGLLTSFVDEIAGANGAGFYRLRVLAD